jgi:hypothetical protein
MLLNRGSQVNVGEQYNYRLLLKMTAFNCREIFTTHKVESFNTESGISSKSIQYQMQGSF